MKASVYTRYGPPEVLSIRDVDTPVPGDNEVLIRVRATTVNRADCGFRTPDYFIIRFFNGFFRPRKKILGSEFAGEIAAVGDRVTRFRPGDRVFGLSTKNFGAHAEYLCLREDAAIATMPDNISFTEAAAVCDGLMLALTYIAKLDRRIYRRILINGATGSIGTAAVQLARQRGMHVTAVANTKNLGLVRSLGADEVLDWTREDFTQCGRQFDVVLDAVGKSSWFRCKKILKKNGIYFSTELGRFSQNIFLALWTPLFSRRKVKFPVPSACQADIRYFRELLASGAYRAVIDRTWPLAEIVAATRYVGTGQKTGNVVITVD